MSGALAETLITAEHEKLPTDIASLVNPALPLPFDVTFFEKRITVGNLISSAAWALGLAIVGLFSVDMGVAMLFDSSNAKPGTNSAGWWPIFFGITCAAATWFMGATFFRGFKLMNAQSRGVATRVGVFLTTDVLVEATETTWCVVPRSQFRGLQGDTVRYQLKDQQKSFRLPDALMRAEPSQLAQAITAWAERSH